MRRISLNLHGRYVEAYLYFDFAWLISKDGLIRAFDIEEFCKGRLNGSGNAASKLFANNQRLFPGRVDPEIDRLLTTEAIDVSEDDLERFSYTFKSHVDFKSVLDIRFYYGRAFYSTEKSIQQFTAQGRDDLEFYGIGRTVKEPLKQRHVSDFASRQFQCRYGAVSAACGRDGGLIGFGASSDESNWEVDFDRFASRSYGIELNPDAISNLRTPTQVEFYHAQSARVTPDLSNKVMNEEGSPDKLELTTVDGPGYQEQTKLIANLVEEVGLTPKRVFLFKSTLWIEFENGTMRRVNATKDDKISDAPTISPSFAAPGRVLSTSLTNIGVIAESDDQVFLYQNKRWHVLVDDQVHSVRGYMNSRRYKHVVTAVRRDKVELISLIN
ncbi:MAG: hypothetical protein V4610_03610 [Pseudomonadota bacterium]|jgi:hypothetical protein